MHSLAKAPPVVTNLQQNCGMKKKLSGPSYCKKLNLSYHSLDVDTRKKANTRKFNYKD